MNPNPHVSPIEPRPGERGTLIVQTPGRGIGLSTPISTGPGSVVPPAVDADPGDGEVHDVVVIGSGPAGYTAALYTAAPDWRRS